MWIFSVIANTSLFHHEGHEEHEEEDLALQIPQFPNSSIPELLFILHPASRILDPASWILRIILVEPRLRLVDRLQMFRRDIVREVSAGGEGVADIAADRQVRNGILPGRYQPQAEGHRELQIPAETQAVFSRQVPGKAQVHLFIDGKGVGPERTHILQHLHAVAADKETGGQAAGHGSPEWRLCSWE